eukprot:3088612-Alexandrium_andersonii.AAC.1
MRGPSILLRGHWTRNWCLPSERRSHGYRSAGGRTYICHRTGTMMWFFFTIMFTVFSDMSALQ